MTASVYSIEVMDEAKEMLHSIARSDKRIASKLADLMENLASLPGQKGRPLGGELTGLHGRHALGNRFPIVYEIDNAFLTVSIISVGIREAGSRRDIYELTKRIRGREGR